MCIIISDISEVSFIYVIYLSSCVVPLLASVQVFHSSCVSVSVLLCAKQCRKLVEL